MQERPELPIQDQLYSQLDDLTQRAAEAIAKHDVVHLPSANMLQAVTIDGSEITEEWNTQYSLQEQARRLLTPHQQSEQSETQTTIEHIKNQYPFGRLRRDEIIPFVLDLGRFILFGRDK